MIYKRKTLQPTGGNFWELSRQVKLADTERFQERIKEALGRKTLIGFFQSRPVDLKIKDFIAVKEVFREFGIALELKQKL